MKRFIKASMFILTILLSMAILLVSANAGILGDIDGDGKLSATDARFILRASVGLEKTSDIIIKLADTDGDNRITASDARFVLRASVGLEKPVSSQDKDEHKHEFKYESLKAPTCTTSGKRKVTCSKCSYSAEEALPATGHSMGKWQVIVEATAQAEGYERSKCSSCSYYKDRSIAVKPAAYYITVKLDAGNSYKLPVAADGKYTLNTPNKTGYIFKGWKTDSGKSFASSGTIKADTAISAVWTLDSTDTLSELVKRAAAGAEEILITKDITVTEPIYVPYTTHIYSDGNYSLTRAANYDGDIFVVGSDKKGIKSVDIGIKATLTLGKGKGTLTVDGNRDNVTVPVNGALVFAADSSECNIYDGVKLINNNKTANVRAYRYNYMYATETIDNIGGAAVVNLSSTLNMYGGIIENNAVATAYTEITNEDGSITNKEYNGCGGAVYNKGTFNMLGGKISGNEGLRGGAVYNNRFCYLIAGEISDNLAYTYGGAVSTSSSSNANTFAGSENTKDKMIIKNNRSIRAGGALYSNTSSPLVLYPNTELINNRSDSSGGAIYTAGPLVAEGVKFVGNTCEYSGGAIYHHYTKAEFKRRYMQLTSCTFEENKGGLGGAIILSSTGTVTNEGTYAEITSCTFTNNEAIVTSTNPGNGGAVYVTRYSDAIIKNCAFSENSAAMNAGALAIHSNATVNISGSSFNNNTSNLGGAVYTSSQSTVNMTDIDFTENSALMTEEGSGGNGGAIYYATAQLSLKNVDFKNNFASNNAGAIYQNAAALTLDNTCSFTGNKAGNHGGAFYLTYSTNADGTKNGSVLKAENVTFTENSALAGGAISGRTGTEITLKKVSFIKNSTPDAAVSTTTGGGAIYSNNSEIDIQDSLFDGNSSGYYGGAIRLDSCESVINNTRILNSSGGTGGAMYASGDSLKADNLTVKGNKSSLNGVLFIKCRNAEFNNLTATDNIGVNGGVIYAGNKASVRIKNSDLSDNTAKYGGALYITGDAAVNADNSKFIGNSIEKGNGGAVYVYGAAFNAASSDFTNNTSTGNGGAIGAFDFQDEATLEKTSSEVDISDCTFTENTGACGGAVYFNDSTYSISNCEFTKNTATSESYGGGAVYNTGATGTIEKATFTKNTALNGGAVAIYTNSSVELSDITATGNEATSGGGAIYANKCAVNLADRSIVLSGNKAKNGGAVYASSAPLFDVSGAVIENNEATGNGGALYASATTLNISGQDTVLRGNKADSYGGAVYLSYVTDESSQKIGGILNVTDAEIKENSALYGGAVSGRTNSIININGSVFSGNSTPGATTDNKAGGGAIYANNSEINISASEITGNTSGYYGGAIFTEVCDVTIKDNTLIDGNNGGTGAALYLTSGSSLDAEKLSITNNRASMNGIIYLNGNDFTLKSIKAEDNISNNNGGVIYTSGKGNLTVTDSVFSRNTSEKGAGGAIYHTATGKLTVRATEFKANSAKNGGAAYINNAEAAFADVSFADNTAAASGGALDLVGSIAEITGESSFNGNSAVSHGGAIYVTYISASKDGQTPAIPSTLTVTDGTFSKNSALGGGAVSIRSNCEAAFDGTVFTENTVTGYEIKADGSGAPDGNAEGGAAVYVGFGKLTLNNVTAENNEALSYTEEGTQSIIKSFGGVVSSTGADVAVSGSRFTGNKASTGGAIHAISASDVTISNTSFNTNESSYSKLDYDNTVGGGAVNIIGGTLNMDTVALDGNKTGYYGGALMASGTKVEIARSSFTNSQGATGAALHFKNRADVTVTDSDIVNNTSSYNGVLYVNNSTVTLEKLNISDNTAKNGGVIYTSNANTRIEINDCTINNNTAGSNGGVVYAENAAVSFNGGTIEKNTAKYGGAVYSDGGKISFTKSVLSANTATNGGVIYAKNSEAANAAISMSEATAAGNKASVGAVICTENAEIQLEKSAFTQNNATSNGGAVYAKLSDITLADCSFTENSSNANGGAISLAGSEMTATGSNLFTANTAVKHAGAIYVSYTDIEKEDTTKERIPGILTMTNGTFDKNTALGGGAVSIRSDSIATFNDTLFTENKVSGYDATTNSGKGVADGDSEGGGAIYVGYGKLYLNNVTATGNIAEETTEEVAIEGSATPKTEIIKSFGGAVDGMSADIFVTGGTFSGNTASIGGAFNLISKSDLTVSGAVIENNESVYGNKEYDSNLGGGAIRTTGGTLILDATTLSGNKSVYYGGAVHTSGTTVTITNGSEIKNSAGGTGAALYFKAGSNVTIENSDVAENTATANGVIYANSSTITANGLNAYGNKAKNGGVFYVSHSSTNIHINNSMISNNTATASGGTVYTESSTVSFTGGTVSSNTAKNGGVAYGDAAKISFTDTEVSGNTATENGGAVYSEAAEITLSGGTASDNSAANGGVIFGDEGSIISVNGTEISKNTATSTAGAISALLSDISLNGAVFTENTAKGNGGALYLSQSELTLNNTEFSNNTSGNHGGAVYSAGSASAATGNNSFTENSAKNHGGAVYLVYLDVENEGTDKKTRIPSTMNMSDGIFTANTALGGGAVSIRSSCDAVFTNTKFTANTVKGFANEADGDGEGGGAFYVGFGTLTLNGVTAEGNIAQESETEVPVEGTNETETKTAISFGGAVDSYSSTITINGGSFNSNKATNGGAVALLNKSELIVDGASFTANESLGNASSVDNKIGGGAIFTEKSTATLSATVFDGNKTNYYGGAVHGIGSTITIDKGSEIKNTTGATGAALYFRDSSKATLNGITVTGNTSTGNGIIYTTSGTVTAENITAKNNTSNYAVLYVSGSSAKADIKGGEWSKNTANIGAAVYVNSSTVTADGVLFSENRANLGGAVFVQRGTFTVTDTEFTGNRAEFTSDGKRGNGGAVSIEGGKLFTDANTSFTANSAANHGGAVYVSYITNDDSSRTVGIFEATGSVFDSNTASVGGAISARTGCVTTLNGTTLKNNSASSTAGDGGGGAIYANDNTVTLSGITATGNSTGFYGGVMTGVNAEVTINNNSSFSGNLGNTGPVLQFRGKSVVTIDTATITNNKVTGGNGIIYMTGNGSLEVTGLTASGNKNTNGGVFYISGSAPVTISNSVLSGNTATGYAGAIDFRSSGKLTVSNTEISGNTAVTGGAINLAAAGATEISGCDITENTAKNGGAMAITGSGTVAINGCSITKNSATGSGGALYITGSGKVTVSENTIIKENTAPIAGAVLLDSGALAEFNASVFEKNTATGGDGGAILVSDSSKEGTAKTKLILNGVAFNENTASSKGGAISTDTASPNIEINAASSSFSKNKALGAGGGAIEIQNENCTTANDPEKLLLTFTNCKFTENTSKSTGAAIEIRTKSCAKFDGIEATGNSAGSGKQNGGVFYVTSDFSRLYLTGTVTQSGNTASSGNFAYLYNNGYNTPPRIYTSHSSTASWVTGVGGNKSAITFDMTSMP